MLAWLQPERPEHFAPERFPVFNLIVEEGRFYGFPVFGVPGFKFGKYHHFEEVADPDYLEREPRLEDEQVLRDFAARHFPTGYGPTMGLRVCLFTNSPDNHFIIDAHPDCPQVSFASACSGHGFKFGSVIGEILADLAERGATRHNIEFFRLDRLLGERRVRGQDRSRTHDLATHARSRRLRRRSLPGDHRALPGRADARMRADTRRLHAEDGVAPGPETSTVADEQTGAIRSFW